MQRRTSLALSSLLVPRTHSKPIALHTHASTCTHSPAQSPLIALPPDVVFPDIGWWNGAHTRARVDRAAPTTFHSLLHPHFAYIPCIKGNLSFNSMAPGEVIGFLYKDCLCPPSLSIEGSAKLRRSVIKVKVMGTGIWISPRVQLVQQQEPGASRFIRTTKFTIRETVKDTTDSMPVKRIAAVTMLTLESLTSFSH